MHVVPVIDLKGGKVVHARQGARAQYLPIRTPLCQGSAPADVVAGLLRLHPFASLYVADLDAIAGVGDHAAVLAELGATWPHLQIWVDAGIDDAAVAGAWLAHRTGHLVLGSESQHDTVMLRSLADEPRAVLSLDFRGETFQGPPALLEDATCWPSRVIAMTLARVGAAAGPDLSRVQEIVARAGRGRQVFAAGGVRDAADLQALGNAGAAGVLVATALHGGAIDADDLRRACGP